MEGGVDVGLGVKLETAFTPSPTHTPWNIKPSISAGWDTKKQKPSEFACAISFGL